MNPLSKVFLYKRKSLLKEIFLLLFILFLGVRLATAGALPITNNSLWSLDIEKSNSSSIVYDNDVLYIGISNLTSGEGILYAVNSTNKNILWNFKYGNLSFRPAVSNDSIFSIFKYPYNSDLFRINKSNGDAIWNNTIGTALTNPVYNDSKIYLINKTSLIVYNSTNGDLICSYIGIDLTLYDFDVQDNIYLAGRDNIYSLNKENCSLNYNVSAVSSSKKILINSNFYFKSLSKLWAYNKTNGDLLWNITIGTDSYSNEFLEINNTIYLTNSEGVKAVNSTNGDLVDRFNELQVRSEPIIKLSYLYFTTDTSLVILNKSNLSQNLLYSIESNSIGSRDILNIKNNLHISGSLNTYRNELNFTTIDNTSIDAGSSTSLNLDNLEDYDEDSVEYEWYEEGVKIATTQNISSYSKSCGNSGDKNITVYVKDKYFSKTKQINVSINHVACSSSSSSSSGGGGSDNSGIYPNPSIVSAVISEISKVNEISLSSFSNHITAIGDFTNEKPNEINVDGTDISLKRISIEVVNSIKDIQITISKAETLPAKIENVKYVYDVIEITPTLEKTNIKSAIVIFSVEKSYLDAYQVIEDNIRIKRFVNGEWVNLPISSISHKDDNVFVSAITPGFSFFAVTLEKAEVEKEATVTAEWDKPKQKGIVNPIITIIILFLAVAGLMYLMFRKGNKNGKTRTTN